MPPVQVVKNTAPAAQERPSVVFHYLGIIRQRLWVFLAVVLLGLILAYFYTITRQKVYEATASLIINPEEIRVLGNKADDVSFLGAGNYWSNQEYFNTQLSELVSFELLTRTVKAPAQDSIANPPNLEPIFKRLVPDDGLEEQQRIREATELLEKSVMVSQDPESRVFFVRVSHPNKVLAADIANRHVATYNQFMRGVKTEGSGNLQEFLAAELESLDELIGKTNAEQYNYRKENGLLEFELQEKKSHLADRIGYYSDALSKAEAKRKELATLRAQVRQLEKRDVISSPIFGLLERTSIANNLKEQYFEEKRKLVELSQEFGPKSHEMKEQTKKVSEVKRMLTTEAKLLSNEVDQRYKLAAANVRKFSDELASLRKEEIDFDRKRVGYVVLEQKRKNLIENKTLLLSRISTTGISGRNTRTNIKPHNRARVAVQVYPRPVVNMFLALFLFSGIGFGVALLLDFLDRRVKSAEDLEQATGVALLGVVPGIGDIDADEQQLGQRDLYVHENPASHIAECCRAIRTNLLFSATDKKLQVLAVSSARPREGKTTMSIYLSTIMAQSGQRVLIIDSDMRRPRLHRSLSVDRKLGLSTLLVGSSTLEESIKASGVPNLDVLPCGPQPPNPAELLLSKRFNELLAQLRKRYDTIILDTPPVLPVTDAVIISKSSDGVLLVAQAGNSIINEIGQAAKALKDVDARIVGTVLNKIDVNKKRYGYYYYQYGYGSDEETPKNKAA